MTKLGNLKSTSRAIICVMGASVRSVDFFSYLSSLPHSFFPVCRFFPIALLRCLPYSAAPSPSSIPQPLAHPVTECKSVYCARAVWCQLYTLTRPQDAVSQDKRVQDVQDQNVFCFSEQGNSFACTCECVGERAQYIYIYVHTHMIHKHIHICMYVCIYIYIHIYIFIYLYILYTCPNGQA